MLKKYEKELLELDLKKEEDILKALNIIYKEAIESTKERLKILMFEVSQDDSLQSKVWRADFQKALLSQLTDIFNKLQDKQFKTIEDYLNNCYTDGFIGALYSLHKQGVPLIVPINPQKVVAALQTDSKLSEPLYSHLGKDVNKLKKQVAHEITRGIATASSYKDISRSLSGYAGIHRNYAMRIVRTEGGRISNTAAFETMKEAKKRGVDSKKKWSAILDSRTRPSHMRCDGEIRELDEPFSNGLMFPQEKGGKAEEVINCRCRVLSSSKWALEKEETSYLGRTDQMTDAQLQPAASKLNISVEELRKYSGQIIPVKADSYEDFRRQYEKIWNYEKVEMVRT